MSLPQCLTCGQSVEGYTWVMPFAFINGARHALVEECHLSCGCVLPLPSMDVAPSHLGPETAIVSIKDLKDELILAFLDNFEEAT